MNDPDAPPALAVVKFPKKAQPDVSEPIPIPRAVMKFVEVAAVLDGTNPGDWIADEALEGAIPCFEGWRDEAAALQRKLRKKSGRKPGRK